LVDAIENVGTSGKKFVQGKSRNRDVSVFHDCVANGVVEDNFPEGVVKSVAIKGQ
jgi:hypothetical protein